MLFRSDTEGNESLHVEGTARDEDLIGIREREVVMRKNENVVRDI